MIKGNLNKRNNYIFIAVVFVVVVVNGIFNYSTRNLERIAENILVEANNKNGSTLKKLLAEGYIVSMDELSQLQFDTLEWVEKQIYTSENSSELDRAILVGKILKNSDLPVKIEFYYILNDDEWRVEHIILN